MNDNPCITARDAATVWFAKLIAEVIEEMGLEDKMAGISPVGCAVFIYSYIDIDWQEAAHGRAPHLPPLSSACVDRLVFTYQATVIWPVSVPPETIHALNRGARI